MELLVEAKNIHVEFAGREILAIETLAVYENDRIGLVGRNGAGKSTLLKVLSGELSPTGCKIRRLGNFTHIPQLEEAVFDGEQDHGLMGRLGVSNLMVQTMSGGEETRLKIAQALSEQAHGILADEPTCHLDREGIELLIGQLRSFPGAVLVISHDRYFLDQVVEKIWELESGRITEHWGNYSGYLRQREEERQNQTARYQRYTEEQERLRRAADEKHRKARSIDQRPEKITAKEAAGNLGRLSHHKSYGSKQKAAHNSAKAIESRMANMEEARPPQRIAPVRFRQSAALALHNPFPVIGENVNKRFSDKILFEDAAFQIPLGAKVALTGGNGTGKTTLLRMILNREEGITVSPKAALGYFAQDGYKFDGSRDVMGFMQEDCDYAVPEIRAVIASMGFSQGDIRKGLSVLSGGEIIKLLLAKMLLGRYNVLLMDEPSTFLDLQSLEALETLIKGYAGTIVFVTHDKRLLDTAADMAYEISDGKLLRMD